MKNALPLAAASILLAACAAQHASTEVAREKTYATGSNLPLRDRGVHVLTPEQIESMRNAASGNPGRAPSN